MNSSVHLQEDLADGLDPFKDQYCGQMGIVLARDGTVFLEPHIDPIHHAKQRHGNRHQQGAIGIVQRRMNLSQRVGKAFHDPSFDLDNFCSLF